MSDTKQPAPAADTGTQSSFGAAIAAIGDVLEPELEKVTALASAALSGLATEEIAALSDKTKDTSKLLGDMVKSVASKALDIGVSDMPTILTGMIAAIAKAL